MTANERLATKEEENTSTLFCVGVGPGDPTLMTLKASHTLEECRVIAAPISSAGRSVALDIAARAVDLSGKRILRLSFSMSTNAAERESGYRTAAEAIEAELTQKENVALVVLGDPSIYATSGHVSRLVESDGFRVQVIPGVPSFCAAAAALGASLTPELTTPVYVLPGTSDLPDGLDLAGTKIIMKTARELPQAIDLLSKRGLLGHTALVANCGMPHEIIVRDLSTLDEAALAQLQAKVGYFTMLVVFP